MIAEQMRAQHGGELALLLDAELTDKQPAVDLLYRLLASTHNKSSSVVTPPVLYNTYQLYLRRSPRSLAFDAHEAELRGQHFGAKIVRVRSHRVAAYAALL